mmetsp:Transcript_7549/g.16463  ORF Transcript_7549/g.16463 Transcript_7549/m.16463 type:complete len:111 (+) Transcript_7549:1617-1949(+)
MGTAELQNLAARRRRCALVRGGGNSTVATAGSPPLSAGAAPSGAAAVVVVVVASDRATNIDRLADWTGRFGGGEKACDGRPSSSVALGSAAIASARGDRFLIAAQQTVVL